MSKVEEIKAQIDALSEKERAVLNDWLRADEVDFESPFEEEIARDAMEEHKAVVEGRCRLISEEELKERIKARYGYEL